MLIHAYEKKDVMTVSSTILQLKLLMLASEILYKCQHMMKNVTELSEKKKVTYARNSD